MPVIVVGKLQICPGERDRFIAESIDAISSARALDACDDFSVSADLIDENRVNIFEKWKTWNALDAFREGGAEHDLFDLVEAFDVNEYEVDDG